jgi:hypothetical protein
VTINNHLFIYRSNYDVYEMHRNVVFNANIVDMAQDTDTLLLTLDNDTLIVYDWQTCKVNHELTDFASGICHMEVRDSMLLCGNHDGDIMVFKEEKVE